MLKFKDHKHLRYFLLYSISFLIYGASISGLGPFIPYLSAHTGIIQTEYSFLFSSRSFGMVAGALLTKHLQKRQLHNHTILILGASGIGLFGCLFTYASEPLWLGIWLFLVGVGYSLVEVLLNVCILLINNPEQIEFWMLLTHGLFGIGGLLGPIIVYCFSTKAFLVLGILTATIIPFCLKIKSPELDNLTVEDTRSQRAKQQTVSWPLQICLCLLLFLYIGNQCTYGGWISSFAVLTKVTDSSGATAFPSIFWIIISICRFILAFVPGSSSAKLKALIQGCICSGVLSLVIIYLGYPTLACYLSAVLFGISMSSIYPLIFSFPLERGLTLQSKQTANIVMAGVVSEGILTMFVGALMEWIHVNMLFYSLGLVALLMWVLQSYSMGLIEQQVQATKESSLSRELVEKPNGMNQYV